MHMEDELELLEHTSDDGEQGTVDETRMNVEEGLLSSEIINGSNTIVEDVVKLGSCQQEGIELTKLNDDTTTTDIAVSPKPAKVRERWWTTLLAILVSSLLAVLFGCSLGFPSPVLLELSQLPEDDLQFDVLLSDIFSVS